MKAGSQKTLKYLLIIILFFSCQTKLQEENHTDLPLLEQLALAKEPQKKVDILISLSREFIRKNLDESLAYANQALSLADSVDYKEGIAEATARKARAVSFKGDAELGLNLYNEAIEKFIQLNEKGGHAEALNDIGTIYLNTSRFDSAKIYFNESYELAASVENDYVQANALGNLANIQNHLTEYDDALVSYERCLEKMTAIGNTRGMSICNANIGTIYEAKGNNLAALEYYQAAQRIDEKGNDSLGVAYNLNNIGTVYRNIERFDKAEEALSKALELAKKANDKRAIAYTLNNLAINYQKLDKLEKALGLQNMHIKLAREIGETKGIANSLYQRGLIYLKKGDLEEANTSLLECKKLTDEIKDQKLRASTLVKLAEIAEQKGELQKAKALAKEAIEIEQMKDNIRNKNEVAQVLSKIYEREGNLKNALQWQKVWRITGDSLLNADKIKEVAGLDYQYQYEKEKFANEAEKSALAEENRAKEKELTRQKRNSILLSIFLLVFIILLTIAVRLNRKIDSKNYELEQLSVELSASNQKLNVQNTEQKRAIDMLEVFAESAAHDLKAPLRISGSYASLLRRKHQSIWSEQENGFWEVIMNNIKKLSKQIDDLLSFSKLGQNLPEPTDISIPPIIEAVKEVYTTQIQSKAAQIILDGDLPVIHGHESLIHRLFQNLISNSLKFSDPDRKPVISIIGLQKEDGRYQFEVCDNGIGISQKDQEKIFALFNRVHNNSNQKDGAGIGLATCKKIVRYYGGQIWVESKEGEGTSMFFELPTVS